MPKRDMDESKGGEGGESKDGLILERAIQYCWGDDFLDVFRTYFQKHAHHFEKAAESKTEEHELIYQELFNEYLGLFEGTLEKFIEREGSDANEFYREVRDQQSSEDPTVQLFIKCLLASADYDSFFNVMKKEAQKQLAENRRGKGGEDVDAGSPARTYK